MNQQTLMAVLSAYPAPKISDELLWRMLTQAWLNEKAAHRRNARRFENAEPCPQSVMMKNFEKILSITQPYWSVQSRAQRRHKPGTIPNRAE